MTSVSEGLRVLKVADGEYPWDVRVEKVSRALTEMGHDVHMVARNRDRRALREELEEASMHRMRPWTWLGRAMDAASQFPAFMKREIGRPGLRGEHRRPRGGGTGAARESGQQKGWREPRKDNGDFLIHVSHPEKY